MEKTKEQSENSFVLQKKVIHTGLEQQQSEWIYLFMGELSL